jgi:hypothetical protein
MRRRTRLGLVIAVLLTLVVCGAYTAFWFVVAGKLEEGLTDWAQSARAQKLDVSWRQLRVGGFPLAFEIELREVALRDEAITPPAEFHAPLLSGGTRPWNFLAWRLTVPDGLSVAAGPAAEPVAKLTARAGSGAVVVEGEGGATIWLDLAEARAEAGQQIAARTADFWLLLPRHPPESHTERYGALAADLRGVTLPQLPAPFVNPVGEIAFGVEVKGAIPTAPPRQAAAAWRAAGGTMELDRLTLRWGRIAITGSGTLALDRDLQPIGGFSGAVEGYEDLMAALVATGRMRPGDARLARVALAMLAKAGPDGRPEIATSFTIQNGEMFLGPAKLGSAPKINWE